MYMYNIFASWFCFYFCFFYQLYIAGSVVKCPVLLRICAKKFW